MKTNKLYLFFILFIFYNIQSRQDNNTKNNFFIECPKINEYEKEQQKCEEYKSDLKRINLKY